MDKRGRRLESFVGRAAVLAIAGVLTLAHAFSTARVSAQRAADISPRALEQISALLQEKELRTPSQRKLDSQLVYGLKTMRGESIASGVRTLAANLRYEPDNKLVLDVSGERGDQLVDELRAVGVEIVNAQANYGAVRIRASLDQLEAIAALPQVRFVQPKQEAVTWKRNGAADRDLSRPTEQGLRTQPPTRDRLQRLAAVRRALGSQDAVTMVGSKLSEGDVTHRAGNVRSTFGVDGTGVRIGVLSNGVAHLALSQALGDLGPVTVLPGQIGTGDEGTAMLEIVHDLAPGAQLYFATAVASIAGFAQNIRDLRDAGCDIIIDDVFYYVETPFQDGQASSVVSTTNAGVVIQAVKDVTASGALYFSSAGNAGNKNDNTSSTWEGDFVDGGATPPTTTAGRIHSFGALTYNSLTVASDSLINLYWSDPLGASSNDYDLFRLDSSGNVLSSSTNIQNGDQDPYEQMGAASPGDRIVIVKKAGSANRFLHLDTNGGWLSISTAGQIHGHAATTAANSFGVAATPVRGPFPNPFNAGNLVEWFSSDGPRRIFFNGDGSAITAGNLSSTGGQLLNKPDLTAADGVLVTGVGGFPSPFFGTSAAAPHAGAIAALIKSANPLLTPEQIRTALVSTAIDIEGAGTDRDSGAGIIDAFAAVQSIALPGNTPPTVTAIPSQTATEFTPTPIAFTVGDGETSATNLTVSAISSNVSIVPNASLVLGGSGANRTLTITPPVSQPFPTTITVTVSDGVLASSVSFALTVVPANPATFDAGLKAPRCGSVGSSCGSGPLLIGKDGMFGGPETNQPNTILNACADGTAGTFHTDESIDAIRVSTDDGGLFAAGKMVTIAATVWAFDISDRVDLYYAADATNPIWTYITTVNATRSGAQTLSGTYVLPAGSVQAVRANLRFLNTAAVCTTGVYDDHDDLIFGVGAPTPPSITQQPQSQNIPSGQTGTLSVAATGTGPLSYQWYLGTSGTTTSPIAGATASTHTTPTLMGTRSYWVRVSNPFGASVNSNTATLTANPPSGLLVQDAFSGAAGSLLTAHAPNINLTGTPWTLNGGAPTPTLVTGGVGVTPGPGHLQVTVNSGVADIAMAVDYRAGGGPGMGALAFRLTDANNFLLLETYQNVLYFYKQQGGFWVPLASQPLPAAIVPGSTHWLEVRTLGSTLEGWWDGARLLQVTESFQQTATRHGLDWNSAFDSSSIYSNLYLRGNGTPAIPPTITTQPQSQTIASGQPATLNVAATGAAPLTYQWYIGTSGTTTTPVGGTTTSSSFTTPPLTASTSYWVRAINAFGTADSATAVVTIGQGAAITTNPQSQTILSGQTASLTVVATGTAPLSYQWYSGASGTTTNPIAGATATSYTTPTLTSTASYWVRVSNPYGPFVSSPTATITIIPPPTITTQPQSRMIASGQTAALSVAATGTGPLTYQWYQGATGITTSPIALATASSYTTPPLTSTAFYWVRVTNAGGPVDSATATITIGLRADHRDPTTEHDDRARRDGHSECRARRHGAVHVPMVSGHERLDDDADCRSDVERLHDAGAHHYADVLGPRDERGRHCRFDHRDDHDPLPPGAAGTGQLQRHSGDAADGACSGREPDRPPVDAERRRPDADADDDRCRRDRPGRGTCR